MENTYLYVKVGGDVTRVDIENKSFNETVHKLIDCTIYELVHIPGDFYLLVDENGKIYSEPKAVNLKASTLYPGTPEGDPIVGDVLIGKLGLVNGEPDMVGLNESELCMLETYFESVDKLCIT